MSNRLKSTENDSSPIPMRGILQQWDCVPLCVDLDGTLITTDSLIQGILEFLRRNPLNIFPTAVWLLSGRAVLKQRIGDRIVMNAASLPYNRDLLGYLKDEYARGRQLVLCTAANERIAGSVAGHLGIFVTVFSSNAKENLKGRNKMKVLEQQFGTGQFDYAGNSWADLAVWRRSRSAIVVNASPWTVLALRLFGVHVSRSFSGSGPQE